MTTLLAIETATDACSVALYTEHAVVERHEICPRQHAERVLPMIDSVLEELSVDKTALDAIAFGQGPGSFLGTRIAAGVAQGMGYALDIPLIPVSTLACLARQGVRRFGAKQVLAGWDARMGQVYFGEYSEGEQREEGVKNPGDFKVSHPDLLYIGNAWRCYLDDFSDELVAQIKAQDPETLECYPRALDMLSLAREAFEQGRVVQAADAEPIYYRDPV